MHDADHERLHQLRRESWIAIGGQLPARDGLFDQRDHLPAAVAVGDPLALRDGRELGREFALVKDNVEHRLSPRVTRKPGEAQHRHGAQATERIVGTNVAGGVEHRLHRHGRALAHGFEQLGLVAEMPVDGAACHAGGGGNLG